MTLRLDIGCGGRGPKFPGFLGIDRHPLYDGAPPDLYVCLDFVRDPLPWGPGTVDEAICLHCIEHEKRPGGLLLIQRALPLLKPGACMTVTCPDLRELARAYLDGDAAYYDQRYTHGREVWLGPTLADKLNWAMHQEGHLWGYDAASLAVLASEAGAADVHEITKPHQYLTRTCDCGIQFTRGPG